MRLITNYTLIVLPIISDTAPILTLSGLKFAASSTDTDHADD